MDNIIGIVFLFSFFGIIGIFLFYFIKVYFSPKKLDQIADMLKGKQFGPAIKRLIAYIEEHDRDIYAHFLLAEAYRLQDQKTEAVMAYRRVIKLGTFTPIVQENIVRSRLANLLFDLKNMDDAKKEFLILTQLDPANSDHYYKLAILHKDAGIQDKALQFFKKCTRINQGHAKAHMEEGILLFKISDIIDAKQSLTQAIKLTPTLYEAHFYLAYCLKQQKEYEWALKEFQISMQDESLKPKAFLGRALCFMEYENYTQAIYECEKGLKYTQKRSETELNLKYLLASAAEHKRDLYTSVGYWEEIISVDPKFKDVQDKLKKYQDLRTEDVIKDFLIANPTKFEAMCKSVVEVMGLKTNEVHIVSDTELYALVVDNDIRWKNVSASQYLFYVYRITDQISETVLRTLYEKMKTMNATKCYCVTAGSFNSQATQFASSRQIELIDHTVLLKYLKGVIE